MALGTLSSAKLQILLTRKDPRVILGEVHKSGNFQFLKTKSDESEDYEDCGFLLCVNCEIVLSGTHGSHLNRHSKVHCKKKKPIVTEESEDGKDDESGAPPMKNRKIDEYSFKKLSMVQQNGMAVCLAKYCLSSGKSFNHAASIPMKNLMVDVANTISSGYGNEAFNQLPSRQTIQKISESLAEKVIKKAHETIKRFAGKRLNFIVDHGKLVVNYLSVYVSFINDSFKLEIQPVAFIPALTGKSGQETARLILQRMEEYGWTEDEVFKSNITADGALSTLGSKFQTYIRCVSHSLNLVGEKIVEPLETHKKKMDDDELKKLSKAVELLKAAGSISSAIRSNTDICSMIPKLPALPIETRWFYGVKCLKDVVSMLESVEKCSHLLPKKIRDLLADLSSEHQLKVANALLLVTNPLLEYNKVFQTQTAVTIHLVLPAYKRLEYIWKRFEQGDDVKDLLPDNISIDDIDQEYLSAFASSGLKALDHYFSQFTDVHFGAVLLSPRTKRMKNFTENEIQRAKRFVVSMLPREPSATREIVTPSSSDSIAKLMMQVSDTPENVLDSDEELDRYFYEYVDLTIQETIEDYWKRKQNEYPALYEVAARVLSVVPSESVCETCFSQAAFLLDKRRTRLQYLKAEKVVIGTQLVAKNPNWI